MKKFLLATAALCSLGAAAQTFDDEDNAFRPQRAEHIDNYVTDATGTRPGLHRIAKPGTLIPLKGSPKIPILLVEFPDRPMRASGKTPQAIRDNFDYFFNGYDDDQVYSHVGSNGSVFGFFSDMSHGQFLPEFELIGPIMMDEGYAYYGSDKSETSKDTRVTTLYKEAVGKAIQQFNVDWSVFDNNGDGSVDFVHIVHAGWGQNANNELDPDAIWAKEMISTTTVTLDDGTSVRFACFAISAEARVADGNKVYEDIASGEFPNGYNPDNMIIDGIGVCVHELSHALGLPDFYDTSYQAYGMHVWSVMDYGCYYGNGFYPVNYTAYERNFLGWEELPVLTEPQVLTIPCFADGGHGYKIVNPANENEYYVIENRQGKGWDNLLGRRAHGLQVTHVDYSSSAWTNNRVNIDAKHQRMTVIPASNEFVIDTDVPRQEYLLALGGVLYPGNTFNYNLTDDSAPAATVFTMNNGAYFMSQPLRNIVENPDGTVTACYRTNGKLPTPDLCEAVDINETGFTAMWRGIEQATRYVVEMEIEHGEVRCDTLARSIVAYTDLPSSASIRFRVMAMADSPEDYLSSEWSDYTYLSTDEDVVRGIDESDGLVMVYNMNGVPVSHCHADGLRRLDVHPGVYIVKYPNGATKKIVLR